MFECNNGLVFISDFDTDMEQEVLVRNLDYFDTTKDSKKSLYEYLSSNIYFNRCCFIGPIETLRKELIKINLNPGESYTGIYRPVLTSKVVRHCDEDLNNDKPAYKAYADLVITNVSEYFNVLNQLEILLDDLISLFKVVAPQKENIKTFGHEIRNIIMLSCSEVDAMMMNILRKNEVKSKGRHYNTNDYVQLIRPLRLKDYVLKIKKFDNLGCFQPFIKWSVRNPSTSLKWYYAYNLIKHDRSLNFHKANIYNALNSVMALAIVIISQYGYRNELWSEKIGKIIKVEKEPLWNIKEFYVPKFENEQSTLINYPF